MTVTNSLVGADRDSLIRWIRGEDNIGDEQSPNPAQNLVNVRPSVHGDVIHSRPDDPRLPAGALDGALIVNAYHEFTAVEPMLSALARALKPGGRLVIVDQAPRGRLREQRPVQERAHELGSWFVVRDLLVAGFRVVRLEDPFIVAEGTEADDDWWLLVAVRPE